MLIHLAEMDKIDIDKLRSVPAYLRKLSNVADNDFVKKMCMINYFSSLMQLITLNLF